MPSTSHDPRAWQRPEDVAGRPEDVAGRPEDVAGRPPSARVVDPEDDLPSSTYAGDFETTAIPRYDSADPSREHAYGLLNDPEPLPYVQPGRTPGGPKGEPTEIEPDVATSDEVRAANRRGTQDLGLMLLRVGFGALLVVHGLQKAFGWWGGAGLDGFEQSLAETGFKYAGLLTYLGVGAQIGAGVLLVLGLFTPLAAAAALAYLINSLLAAVAAQPDDGVRFSFFLPDGHEYLVTLIVVAAALALTGPGRYGFDAGRGWARRPFVGSAVALLVGVGVGVGAWLLLNGTNPFA